MMRVSCKASLEFSILLDCKEGEEPISIIKRHMHTAALQAALDMKRDGIDTVLTVSYLVAYDDT